MYIYDINKKKNFNYLLQLKYIFNIIDRLELFYLINDTSLNNASTFGQRRHICPNVNIASVTRKAVKDGVKKKNKYSKQNRPIKRMEIHNGFRSSHGENSNTDKHAIQPDIPL